jgi:HAD superfamily hydrolase (TIGR01509 family)
MNPEILLCDADGNLFPSEEPAFDASVEVTNRLMAALGLPTRFTATELRLATTGKNFRTTAADLAAGGGAALEPEALERWVAEERREVTAHLRATLAPDPGVVAPLTRLSRRFALAAVSSSAEARLDGCFEATGLAGLIPAGRRFSAEDSLPVPIGKPDPAIYRFAGERLGIETAQGLAIEDSVPGAESALAAGFQTLGNVMFVPAGERADRIAALREAGVTAVVSSWQALEAVLA